MKHAWIGLILLFVVMGCQKKDKGAASPLPTSAHEISGEWFTDVTLSTALDDSVYTLDLTQQNLKIQGSYATSDPCARLPEGAFCLEIHYRDIIGSGDFSGTISGDELKYELTSTATHCTALVRGSGFIHDGGFITDFQGVDCNGNPATGELTFRLKGPLP